MRESKSKTKIKKRNRAPVQGVRVHSPSPMGGRVAKKPAPVRIKLAPGVLSKFGYASTLSAQKRRKALAMAIVARGKEKKIDRRAAALSIFRRLNVLVLYRKNAPPSKAKAAFEADKVWVKKRI